ncbi:MAG: histidinol dehydrogenase [Erysipelotrichaceae bacterium]|jgi:histidinol dehydrogenase|nr:histidinol dehydrogenase [Erysipelotrichaceae bacterium]
MLKEIKKEDQKQLREYLDSRTQEINADVLMKVSDILHRVREEKDAALIEFTKKFDGVDLKDFRVSEDEIDEAEKKCDPFFMESMRRAAANIRTFHEAQVQNSYLQEKEMGIYLGQRVLPLASVGIYVPGGRAQYPSSVLMNAIPAHAAGVKRIVMVTPPNKEGGINPNIAFAARLAGVTEIYKVGGAQAIGALAYGTESIPAVDKIVGPGNIYVAAAKKLVYGKVDIDMIAGPSEILVIADEDADPCYVAADLLSQAEHDPLASAILLTDSRSVLDKVDQELKRQSALLPKREIVEQSLQNYGKAIVCASISECIAFANAIAPEHLELCVKDAMNYLGEAVNAGSIFLGYYTCESIGDYFGGTNHVLPTSGTARFSSALGVDAFVKKSYFMHYTKEAVNAYGKYIVSMAKQEGLQGHAQAVLVRMDDGKEN